MTAKKTIYSSSEEKSQSVAKDYNKTFDVAYRYLAYRDVPALIRSSFNEGKIALDYGCGTGISSEFLESMGFQVDGVDVSSEMLNQAKSKFPTSNFKQVTNGSIPFESDRYDLIFSSFVLFEIGSKKEIANYLLEAKRVLNERGVFVLVAGSGKMYSEDWLVFSTDFPENKQLSSGDEAKIFLPVEGIEFTDFYWTEKDYQQLFEEAGLSVLETHYPLGKEDDPYDWKEEVRSSPYVIYVLGK